MRNSNFLIVGALTVMMFLFSCKVKKSPLLLNSKVEALVGVPKIDITPIVKNQLNFTTFSTKAASNLRIDNKEYDVTLSIRIQKGEKIWISISAIAGLEIARAVITKDSIKVLDRINSEFLNKPFSYIHDFSNKQLDYLTLEALLVGNCVPFTFNQNNDINNVNGNLSLKGKLKEINYQLNFNQDNKPVFTQLSTEFEQQMLKVNTPSFEQITNQLVPTKVFLDSKSLRKQVQLTMEYSKTQMNLPIDFPFNVPKRFSEID
jgi:hypothetical protein